MVSQLRRSSALRADPSSQKSSIRRHQRDGSRRPSWSELRLDRLCYETKARDRDSSSELHGGSRMTRDPCPSRAGGQSCSYVARAGEGWICVDCGRRRPCDECGKPLQPIGRARANGVRHHGDWSSRTLHKKCWIIRKKREDQERIRQLRELRRSQHS